MCGKFSIFGVEALAGIFFGVEALAGIFGVEVTVEETGWRKPVLPTVVTFPAKASTPGWTG